MSEILAKLTKIVEHRADMAYRWFKIKDAATATMYVCDDPDVQAHLQNPVVANEIFRVARLKVIDEIISGVNIAEHRERFGDGFVDRVLSVSARLSHETEDSR
jgi:hypothetical protein